MLSGFAQAIDPTASARSLMPVHDDRGPVGVPVPGLGLQPGPDQPDHQQARAAQGRDRRARRHRLLRPGPDRQDPDQRDPPVRRRHILRAQRLPRARRRVGRRPRRHAQQGRVPPRPVRRHAPRDHRPPLLRRRVQRQRPAGHDLRVLDHRRRDRTRSSSSRSWRNTASRSSTPGWASTGPATRWAAS